MPEDTSAPTTMIYAGEVLAVPGEAPIENATIVIQDGKIVRIENGFLKDEDATIIDKRDMFVLPGLIDSHVHLRGEWSPTSRWEPVTPRRPSWQALPLCRMWAGRKKFSL